MSTPTEYGDWLYGWQERTAEGWGLLHAWVPAMGMQGALITRNEQAAREMFGPIARRHVDGTGHPLRLVRFIAAEVLTYETPL